MTTSPDKWETVKELFEAALEADSARRSSFLENRCADPSIRAEVERLLDEHDKAGTFLSTPALDNLAMEVETAATPQRLTAGEVLAGRFRIVGFIASGGMGEVYEAEDEELRERVAVKTIRPEILSQPNAIARFRREVHLARQVTHPNVCRIFDLFRHKPDGRHGQGVVFISMELLHGPHLGTRLKDGGQMSAEEALPLIRQMGLALGAAHAVGIVHRDFKPQNVVLVRVPGQANLRAVVSDFGLALQSENWGGTHSVSTGQGLLGTPAYMSPEQIEGRAATTASDIYAFGLVIYEMVTGNRPFCGDTPMSAAMKRLSEAPTPPRKFVVGLNPLWESVILRCLERDPARRFASAEDVAKALAGEDSTLSRDHALPKWFNRRTAVMFLAALLIVAVGLGYEVLHRRAVAPTAKRINPRRSVAVLGFKNLSGKPEEGWLSTALSELLTAELSAGEQLRTVPGESLAEMKVSLGLQDADGYGKDTLSRIRRVVDADDVLVGSYLALGKETGGKVHLDLKLQDVSAGETTAVIVEEGTENDLPELVSRAGTALLQKLGVHELTPSQAGGVTASVSDNPEANRWYAEGLVKLRNFDPLAARDLLQTAVKRDDTFALAHSALSEAWSQLGYDQKAKAEAERAFDLSVGLSREDRLVIESRYRSATKDWPKAIEVDRALYTFFPDNLEYGLRLAAAQTKGGKARDALSTVEQLRQLPTPTGGDPRIDMQEARCEQELGDARRRKAAAQRAEQKAKSAGMLLLAASARFTVGGALYDLGQPKDAMTAYEEALQTYQRLGDRVQVGNAYNDMSEALQDIGDLAAARKAAEQGLAIFEEIGNVDGQALVLNEIAIIMRHAGDFPGAMKTLEKSYALKKEIGDKSGMIAARGNLANVFESQGDLLSALRTYQEVLQLSQEIGSKRFEAVTIGNIANVRAEMGEVTQALQDFQRGIDLSREIGNKFATLWDLGTRSDWLINSGDLAAGAKDASEVLSMASNSGENAYIAVGLQLQGEIAFDKGDLSTAHQRYQEAVDRYHKGGDLNAEAQAAYLLGDVALEQGKFADAETLARQAVIELDKERAQTVSLARATLARVFLAQSKLKEAHAEISHARATSRTTQNLTVSIPVQIVYARVQAKRGLVTAAMQLLQKLSEDCRKYRFIDNEFEARLALGEIQMRSEPKAGLATLQSLADDADARGFALMATKAAAVISEAGK